MGDDRSLVNLFSIAACNRDAIPATGNNNGTNSFTTDPLLSKVGNLAWPRNNPMFF